MPGLSDDLGKLTPHLRRFARALVRGHAAAAADDLVQETVLLAARPDRSKGGRGFAAWCYGTIVRLNRLRDRAPWSSMDVDGSGPFPFLARDVLRLDALPLEGREVLLLTAVAGLTYDQVAEALDVEPGEAFARLTRARDALLKAESGDGARIAGVVQRARAADTPHLRLVK